MEPFVCAIFEKGSDLEDVLTRFADRYYLYGAVPTDILEKRAVLYLDLYGHDNEEVVAWSKSQYRELQEIIRMERERENQLDRERNESFE